MDPDSKTDEQIAQDNAILNPYHKLFGVDVVARSRVDARQFPSVLEGFRYWQLHISCTQIHPS